MGLPALNFSLPEWHEKDFKAVRLAESKLTNIKQQAGISSLYFKSACQKLESSLSKRKSKHLIKNIDSTLSIRAFTYMLANSDEFVDELTLDQKVIEHFESLSMPISGWSLSLMIQAFLNHFDNLGDSKVLKSLGRFIQKQLNFNQSKRQYKHLKLFYQHRKSLFNSDGPQRFVEVLNDLDIDFDDLVEEYGLQHYTKGRYLNYCRNLFYIGVLKSLPVGEDHPVLQKLSQPDLLNTPVHGSQHLIGHEVLNTLIERTGDQEPSQSWRNTVMKIAGDPRSAHTDSYKEWWAQLDKYIEKRAMKWMIHYDLDVFTAVLDQLETDDDSPTEDQFVDRGRQLFLQGLFSESLITETRLFLSNAAIKYFENQQALNLPQHAKLTSRQAASMIHIKIADKLHVIEGSHSFRLKVLDKLPASCDIENNDTSRFSLNNFKTNFARDYYNEFGYDGGLQELSHDTHLNWQNRALSFLRENDIHLPAEKVICTKRIVEYKQKFRK